MTDARGHPRPGSLQLERYLAEQFKFPADKAFVSMDEPPLLASVSLGSATDILNQDRDETLDVAGHSVAVKVSERAVRRFDHLVGIRFVYPKGFRFEYEAGQTRWSLRGRGATLYVQKTATRAGGTQGRIETETASLKRIHPEAKFELQDTVQLGGKRPPGFRAWIEGGGLQQRLDFAFIEHGENTYVLETYCVLDKQGNPSDDAVLLAATRRAWRSTEVPRWAEKAGLPCPAVTVDRGAMSTESGQFFMD
jgi:hypothetical protein